GGLVMLFAARTLDGITGGNITTAQAYVTDVSTPETRTQSLGLLTAAFGLGFIFGPALGGFLSQINVITPFIGAAIITLGTLILTIITLEESLPPEKRGKSVRKKRMSNVGIIFSNPDFGLVVLIGFMSALAFSAIPPTFSLYASEVLFKDIPDPSAVSRNIGLMLTFMGVITVVTQMKLIRPLVKRYGERNLVLAGQIILCIAMLNYSLYTAPVVATIMLAPWAFARGISDPSMQSLVTRFGDDNTRGQLLGLYQSFVSLAFIFGPIWSGYIFQTISPQAVFITGGLLVIPAFLASLRLKRIDLPGGPARGHGHG
ncbi:MAG: MFS transporter, partial [Anaerolineae bacterium]|nr:MFS transporter [Anaerolineae bacterium]